VLRAAANKIGSLLLRIVFGLPVVLIENRDCSELARDAASGDREAFRADHLDAEIQSRECIPRRYYSPTLEVQQYGRSTLSSLMMMMIVVWLAAAVARSDGFFWHCCVSSADTNPSRSMYVSWLFQPPHALYHMRPSSATIMLAVD
jgi:hypothetical protein